jgi:hypothetical protein
MTHLIRGIFGAMAVVLAMPASAQSLAEVAKKEEARRTTAPKAVKSYSNADLSPSDLPPPKASEPADPCYESSSLNKCVPADELLERVNASTPNVELAKEEDGWRRSAEQIRALVLRLQEEIKIPATTAVDESRSAGERALAAGRVAKMSTALRSQQEKWAALEKDAEFKRVPHAWLEPVPPFELSPPPKQ